MLAVEVAREVVDYEIFDPHARPLLQWELTVRELCRTGEDLARSP